MPRPMIGAAPMTATERSARRRQNQTTRIRQLEAKLGKIMDIEAAELVATMADAIAASAGKDAASPEDTEAAEAIASRFVAAGWTVSTGIATADLAAILGPCGR